MINAAIATIIVGLILFIWYWIQKPYNRIVRLGDLGLNVGDLKGVYRERQIERLAKLRRVGDLPPVFPNAWFCVCESSDLKPKQIKEITVFGKLLSLVRAEDGTAYIMDSYCPHIGASFNVGGKVVDNNCVQCPFHGWVFSADTGKCTRIPYNPGSIPEQAKVATWPCVERNKHIYVWYHCDGHDPEWEVPEIPELTKGEWTYSGRTEHEVMCHCQEIPENGADIAHLNYLHLSGPQDGNNVNRIPLETQDSWIRHIWNGTWEPRNGDEKHISAMHLIQHMTLFNKFHIPCTDSDLWAIQVGPGIVHMMFDFGILGKGVVLQHVTPEEPLLQRVRFKMYSNIPAWFCKFFLFSEATQFERDVWVWSNKRYIRNPLVVKNDGPIQKHRRWYSQFYSENSPRLLPNGELSDQARSINDW